MAQLLQDTHRAGVPGRMNMAASRGQISYPFLDIEFDTVYGERKFSMAPEKMPATYVGLAADPGADQQTGKYWAAPGVESGANRNANNRDKKRPWAVSEIFTNRVEYDLD